jgi:hypothetical protein
MNKAISDFEALDNNLFYQRLVKDTREHLGGLELRLRSVGLDGFQKLQGEISSIYWVLEHPKTLIAEILKEDNTTHA